ncbi:hypothetical protein ACFX2C_004296 [Malus domestica]
MKFRVGSLLKLRIFLPTSPNFQSFPKTLLPATWFIFTPSTYSTIYLTEEEVREKTLETNQRTLYKF